MQSINQEKIEQLKVRVNKNTTGNGSSNGSSNGGNNTRSNSTKHQSEEFKPTKICTNKLLTGRDCSQNHGSFCTFQETITHEDIIKFLGGSGFCDHDDQCTIKEHPEYPVAISLCPWRHSFDDSIKTAVLYVWNAYFIYGEKNVGGKQLQFVLSKLPDIYLKLDSEIEEELTAENGLSEVVIDWKKRGYTIPDCSMGDLNWHDWLQITHFNPNYPSMRKTRGGRGRNRDNKNTKTKTGGEKTTKEEKMPTEKEIIKKMIIKPKPIEIKSNDLAPVDKAKFKFSDVVKSAPAPKITLEQHLEKLQNEIKERISTLNAEKENLAKINENIIKLGEKMAEKKKELAELKKSNTETIHLVDKLRGIEEMLKF